MKREAGQADAATGCISTILAIVVVALMYYSLHKPNGACESSESIHRRQAASERKRMDEYYERKKAEKAAMVEEFLSRFQVAADRTNFRRLFTDEYQMASFIKDNKDKPDINEIIQKRQVTWPIERAKLKAHQEAEKERKRRNLVKAREKRIAENEAKGSLPSLRLK